MIADVRCPECEKVRILRATDVRKEVKRASFKGLCRPCAFLAVKAGTHRWLIGGRHPKKPSNHKSGYVLVSPHDVADNDLPTYRKMQRSGQPVLKHRLVMALYLGRPLESFELVDHKDGDKKNNAIDNLRIYIRGKQQPGSAPGYGTFYHEWQMAERRVRELEAQLRSNADAAARPGSAAADR